MFDMKEGELTALKQQLAEASGHGLLGDNLKKHIKLFQKICREFADQWHNRQCTKFLYFAPSVFGVCHSVNVMVKTNCTIKGKKTFYSFVTDHVNDMTEQTARSTGRW